MDGRRRLFTSSGGSFPRASCSHCSEDGSAKLWHSTPIKKKDGAPQLEAMQPCGPTRGTSQWVQSVAGVPADPCCAHNVQEAELPVKDLSSSTIQKQRRELQLLMAELKDREGELNTMSASHHKQHQAWEQDRQSVLMLEQRCARLDEELQRCNEVIRVLTKHVWIVESKEKEVQKELGEAKLLLCDLEKKQQQVNQRCQDYEAKNQSLSSTVMALSTQVGSLQVREEELSSMLKLKDKDVSEASSHILELSGRLQDLERLLAESRSQENKLLRDSEEMKRCYKDAKREVSQLRAELQQHVTQSSTRREEIIRLKQELQLLHTDLALTGEGESWKDELLELSRSKQERIMSELLCLQQVCENQRNDLQLLRLNQESTQRALREKPHQGLLGGKDDRLLNCVDVQSTKNLRPDLEYLPAAEVQASGAANSKIEGLSASMRDQVLGKSRLLQEASESSSLRHHGALQPAGHIVNSRTSEPLYMYECQTAHHHPNTTILKTNDTPPKACLHHNASQQDSNVDSLI
ncbi:coiled-coil domain-containing protein 62 isoform X2 [Girardinichthys multiradiatus]|uniref:coiled-coil domain-containing protein 62 isoform X2 n=1 Tax=Girardinichthys multiradiatus TaxID=208333 RepID=UPI001FAC51FE|nr:coiled-coil domain-containing protein 62 isoform X2 [Girardinichthys multiradiatus]